MTHIFYTPNYLHSDPLVQQKNQNDILQIQLTTNSRIEQNKQQCKQLLRSYKQQSNLFEQRLSGTLDILCKCVENPSFPWRIQISNMFSSCQATENLIRIKYQYNLHELQQTCNDATDSFHHVALVKLARFFQLLLTDYQSLTTAISAPRIHVEDVLSGLIKAKENMSIRRKHVPMVHKKNIKFSDCLIERLDSSEIFAPCNENNLHSGKFTCITQQIDAFHPAKLLARLRLHKIVPQHGTTGNVPAILLVPVNSSMRAKECVILPAQAVKVPLC